VSETIHPHGTTIADSTERRQDGSHGIGERRRKLEGADKATGRTIYADDIVKPGMLHAKIKRSIKAHAKIVSIDVSEAEKLEGVIAIVTGKDFPDVKYGIIPWTRDEYPLCREKARFIGDGVAAVAAVDEETAELACRRIKVTYEDLPPVHDTETAKVSGDDEATKVNEKAKRGNVTKRVKLEFGDVDGALAGAEHVVDDVFYFQGTTHAAIEPHCAIGEVDERGRLTVTSSTQVPHYLHRDLARSLNLPESRVRVVQPAVGGAFGGKSEPFDLEFVVALLALRTGKPVKLLYTREEVFYSHRGRHPMRMRFQTACDDNGKIKACRTNIDIDGGAYASFGMITAYYAGQLLTGPVGMETYGFEATRFYTNKPACGPKRGHGSVQPRFGYEIHLDMLAEKAGLDPMEIRRRNFVGEGNDTVNGQRVGSSGLYECLDAVAEGSEWDARRGKLPRGRGLGVATSMYISGTNYPIYPNDMPQSAVQVRLDRSGKVMVFCGASDIGQGSDSVLAYLACEELGVELDDVNVVSSDTDLTPVDLGAYSSRVTLMMGHAAQEAFRKLREQVQEAVAERWTHDEENDHAVRPEHVLLGDGRVWFSGDTELSMTTREAFRATEAKFGALGSTGGYRTKQRGGDYRGGTIGSSPAYSCTAHVADVTVDERTGRIAVNKIWVAHDCGRALNPVLVEGQVEGSTYMGMAEVALEEMKYGQDAHRAKKLAPVEGANRFREGMLVGPSLLDYRIPTTLDTPAIEAFIVEKPDPNGPYGAKEAGEGPLHSTIPAIANAVYDAVGIRLFELPFTPAKVLAALKARDEDLAKAAE
jgi:4-hydroxybenzoyl-CoA reductase alpha subunit